MHRISLYCAGNVEQDQMSMRLGCCAANCCAINQVSEISATFARPTRLLHKIATSCSERLAMLYGLCGPGVCAVTRQVV